MIAITSMMVWILGSKKKFSNVSVNFLGRGHQQYKFVLVHCCLAALKRPTCALDAMGNIYMLDKLRTEYLIHINNTLSLPNIPTYLTSVPLE